VAPEELPIPPNSRLVYLGKLPERVLKHNSLSEIEENLSSVTGELHGFQGLLFVGFEDTGAHRWYRVYRFPYSYLVYAVCRLEEQKDACAE
jgi:hypothetical protein